MSSPTELYPFAPPTTLTAHQWQTLLHLSNGLIPHLTPTQIDDIYFQYIETVSNPEPKEKVTQFLGHCATEREEYVRFMRVTMQDIMGSKAVKEIAGFLDLITSTVGGLLLNGTTTPFLSLPPSQISTLIQGYHSSRIRSLRVGIKCLSFLIRHVWLRGLGRELWDAVGFPGDEILGEMAEGFERDVEGPGQGVLTEGKTESFKLTGEAKAQEVITLRTGVLVIGSGCGGSSFTHSLARHLSSHPRLSAILTANFSSNRTSDILVTDKGFAKSPPTKYTISTSTSSEHSAYTALYDSAMVLASEDNGISFMAASTWGGGSRVNWSACLQTDRGVREEWTRLLREGGAKGKEGGMFLGREWQDCLDYVEQHIGAQTPSLADHNPSNTTLMEGARMMGYRYKAVPQNFGSSFQAHGDKCGARCTTGCRVSHEEGGKMSGPRAFLWPVMRKEGDVEGEVKVSVKGLEGFEVDKLLFDEDEEDRVIGAVGWVKPVDGGERKRVVIRADKVVVAGGSMDTPVLLQKSGLTNPNIGQNLHVHPCLVLHSRWKEEIRPWEGTILTSLIGEFDNLDHHGHGVKIEALDSMPVLVNNYAPWSDPAGYKQWILNYKHTQSHIILCREKNPGKVWYDRATGERRISYVPSAFDRAHTMEGMIGLAKLLYTLGAVEITPAIYGVSWKRVAGEEGNKDWSDDETFQQFLVDLRKAGNDIDRAAYGTAHQMGTCKMGSNAASSVVDTKGKVWGVDGLYVADASVFPTASGCNPMLTVLGFGEWIGRRMVEDMAAAVA